MTQPDPEHVEGQLTLDGEELTPEEILERTSATSVRLDVDGFLSDWLDSHEAWPDGEPSGVWTAETFAMVLGKEYHSAEHMIREMDLQVGYTVTITDDKGRTARVVFKP